MKLIMLAVAGAGGTLARYLLGGWAHQLLGASFPFGTLTVNVLGCTIIGLVGTLADERSLVSPELRFVILLGFLGAFTTFSSFTYETWALFRQGEILPSILNVVGSLLGCFVGLLVGVLLARLL